MSNFLPHPWARAPSFSPGPRRLYASLKHLQHATASKTSTSSPSSPTTRWPMKTVPFMQAQGCPPYAPLYGARHYRSCIPRGPAKEDPASCVRHENCLVSPEELIHLGPELGLIAFLGCVDVLVRRVRTLAAI